MPDNILLTWTLEAKRGLSQAEHLSSHANSLHSQSVVDLDHAHSLIAKCQFLSNALRDQVSLLEKTGEGCFSVEAKARHEFEVLLRELDSLDLQLNEKLVQLKHTPLDPGFALSDPNYSVKGPPRTSLHDFVDESGIENLKTKLRQAIDDVQESHDILLGPLQVFTTDILSLISLTSSLSPPVELAAPPHPSSSSAASSDFQAYTTHVTKQEYHAHHIADLLVSLAQHYDQTSHALKEFEQSQHLSGSATSETMAIGMNNEGLEVLERDAADLPEVLEELEDHVQGIESSSKAVHIYYTGLQAHYNSLVNIFKALESYGKTQLQSHLTSLKEFITRTEEYRSRVQELKEKMSELVSYYRGFHNSYHSLIQEVARRIDVHSHTTLFISETTQKLKAINQAEVQARQRFMDQYAAYLPESLWRGVWDPPIKVEIRPVIEGTQAFPILQSSTAFSPGNNTRGLNAGVMERDNNNRHKGGN